MVEKRLREFFRHRLSSSFSNPRNSWKHPGDNNQPEGKEKVDDNRRLLDFLESKLPNSGEERRKERNAIVIRAAVFALIIGFVFTARYVHVIHKPLPLNVRIHTWAEILLVLVSGLPFVRVVTYLISEPLALIFWRTKYITFFIHNLKRSVDVTLWLMIVFSVWLVLLQIRFLHPPGQSERGSELGSREKVSELKRRVLDQITRMLLAVVIGAVLWTGKKAFFLKILADHHLTGLCDRIRQVVLDFIVIEYFSCKDTADCRVNVVALAGEASSSSQGAAGIPRDAVSKVKFWDSVWNLKKKNAPIWLLEMMIKHLHKYSKNTSQHPPFVQLVENAHDNEKLMEEANNMHQQIMGHVNDVIHRSTLVAYGLSDKQIEQVFKLFPSTKDKKEPIITREDFLAWAIKAVKNCKGLKRTVDNSRCIFRRLEFLMSLFVVALTLVIWLLLSRLTSTSQIAILFTPFVSASFIFGDSLKTTFHGLSFVFGIHPFDVGDRVIIDKVEMKVEELNIQKTVFTICDNGKQASYPNSLLYTKSIINLEVEPEESDSINFNIPIDTQQELITDLKIKIKKKLDDGMTFAAKTKVVEKQIYDRKVTMTVYFKYLVTDLSGETKAEHRSKVLFHVIKLCKQMEIERKRLQKGIKTANKSRLVAHSKWKVDEMEEEARPRLIRFDDIINVKHNMSDIKHVKKAVMRAIENYNELLKDCSLVVLHDIKEEYITMDVRIYVRITDDDKADLRQIILKEIKKNLRDRKAKQDHGHCSSTDSDDDCH